MNFVSLDFVPYIDQFGEPQTAALLGLALAFAFGFIAERSQFCTRSAVLDVVFGRNKQALGLWLIAFAVSVLAVQYLVTSGAVAVSETRFFSTPQSLSGALIGGALFGIGMALARGCASRLMILGASGNLRAITAVLVMAGAAWATFQGFLVPARDAVGSIASTAHIGGNNLLTQLGLGPNTGIFIGAILLILAVAVSFNAKLSPLKAAAGLAIGGLVAAGWLLTYQLSQQVFEPIAAESLSFIRPSANAINLVISGADESFISLDTGLFFGLIFGAFISSIVFRSFKIRTFAEAGAPHFARYLIGGALMGFGGILAVGCTIGAGFTGGSVLAISSLLGLVSMLVFSGLTDWLIAKVPTGKTSEFRPIAAE